MLGIRCMTALSISAVFVCAHSASGQISGAHPSIAPNNVKEKSVENVQQVLGGISDPDGASFVNWESPHVNPIDITPNGLRILAVNTADNRLEVFRLNSDGYLEPYASIPVGLDPVSVRARNNVEAWVVNHISDSISVVNLTTLRITRTIRTGDEPADIVFAGTPKRAFVSISQFNQLEVYDPNDLTASPQIVPIEGEDPRALATDGTRVFAAIFESGNGTTVLNEVLVSSPDLNPYPGDPNPPPNDGSAFDPPLTSGLETPPPVSMIVKKQSNGMWVDDNNGDWSTAVFWDLHDHDVAIINADTLNVTYATGLMNILMNLSVHPTTGKVVAIGTEAHNEIRFEPNLNGVFSTVMTASFDPTGPDTPFAVLLNPHMPVPISGDFDKSETLGDPRGIDWLPNGNKGFVTGLGSNNVAVIGPNLARIGSPIAVGDGPTGVRVHPGRPLAFVVNKFDGSISMLNTTDHVEEQRLPFHDPTPTVIKTGRPHLYSTTINSMSGALSCGTCHVDGRMDQIAWDLGAPDGEMKAFNQQCTGGSPNCVNWHPMKGPMTTQTLVGIVNTEPLHWRGDREDLAAFSGAFVSLLGKETEPSPAEIDEFEAFAATMQAPPNPYRNIDGSLNTGVFNGGDAASGREIFNGTPTSLNCIACHALPTGTDSTILPPLMAEGITQNMKTAQLRNLYEKTGFEFFNFENARGFGFIHDGSIASLQDFINLPEVGVLDAQQKLDLEAFLLSLATDTHAGVGVQVSITNSGDALDGAQLAMLGEMLSIAEIGDVALVAKGFDDIGPRGWYLLGSGVYQSDHAGETAAHTDLLALASSAAPMSFTIVPAGTEVRIGVDRDEDGFFDADEVDACSNVADPTSTPDDPGCLSDFVGAPNGPDGDVNVFDLLRLLEDWGDVTTPANIDCQDDVNIFDLLQLLEDWGACP